MTHSPMFGAQMATRSPRSTPLAMKGPGGLIDRLGELGEA